MRILLYATLESEDKRHKFLIKLICQLLILNAQIRSSKSQKFLTPADFQLAMREEEVTFLTELDYANARKFKKLFEIENARRNILTKQPFYRGDIRGKAALRRERRPLRRKLGTSNRSGRRFNGVANVVKKWPNGRIPYVLSLEYSARERAVLARAFEEYHVRSCIRFVPKSPFDDDYLFIGKIDGCYSDVGRAGGRQELSLDNGCLHLDTIIHELMHSVGFYHEHERWDRDKYLVILWHNIDKDAYDQFGRVDLLESSYYEMPYDYHSIMHYDSLAFSKNGLETLVAKEATMTRVIGSAIDFSPIDLSKIRRMYRCFMTPETETQQIDFIGDNSVTNPSNKAKEVDTPSFGMPFPLTAEVANFEPLDLSSVPFYLRMNAPIWRKLSTKTEQNESQKGDCADKMNLCALWTPFCHSDAHKYIVQKLCRRSCNLCEESQKMLQTIYHIDPMKPFPQMGSNTKRSKTKKS